MGSNSMANGPYISISSGNNRRKENSPVSVIDFSIMWVLCYAVSTFSLPINSRIVCYDRCSSWKLISIFRIIKQPPTIRINSFERDYIVRVSEGVGGRLSMRHYRTCTPNGVLSQFFYNNRNCVCVNYDKFSSEAWYTVYGWSVLYPTSGDWCTRSLNQAETGCTNVRRGNIRVQYIDTSK